MPVCRFILLSLEYLQSRHKMADADVPTPRTVVRWDDDRECMVPRKYIYNRMTSPWTHVWRHSRNYALTVHAAGEFRDNFVDVTWHAAFLLKETCIWYLKNYKMWLKTEHPFYVGWDTFSEQTTSIYFFCCTQQTIHSENNMETNLTSKREL